MRVFFRRFLAGRRRAGRLARLQNSTCYRSAAYTPLRPWQVRGRTFTPRGRGGVDAVEVREFLDRIADDLATAYAAVAASRDEAARVKAALRQWQSRQARFAHNMAHR
jgi:DivIVA domain-containing protein